MTPPSIQKFDLEDTGKLVAIVAASEMTREYLIKQKILTDHNLTGSSYLFHRLSKDSIDKERKRHNAVIEQLQKAQIEWAHKQQQ